MDSVDTIVIDNIEYIIVDDIEIDGVRYIYLVVESDPKNFCIRKIKEDNGIQYVVNLDTEDEFNKALIKLKEKDHS